MPNAPCPITAVATLREAALRLQAGEPFRQSLMGETPCVPVAASPTHCLPNVQCLMPNDQ
ncbi:MAG: hypothetical protein KME32_20835 [Mojavia pulchra JT2-VF2]|uniref:Uncharacterized protein n=1 Tax=Mojavia pulchra JT2-VF2 TaxID=287848 RepID=A0A951Q2I7_9NOST|nr:hypothetical protein [Mojavia pulchra JT2-VF2]